MQEPIEFLKETTVVAIPDGTPLVVPEGTQGTVVQVLGGNFTVRLQLGHLVRVNGTDAEAIGCEIPEEAQRVHNSEFDDEMVWAELRNCYDPEIPVNIVDLGLIYGLEINDLEEGGKRVKVTMTLTAPGCGMGQVLKDDVESKVRALPGVIDAEVELTFEPPWGPDRMTEEAQLELGFY